MELRERLFPNVLSVNDLTIADRDPFEPPAPPEPEKLDTDLWGFDFFWREVRKKFNTVENLYAAIEDLHRQIREIKEKYRSLTGTFPDLRIEPNGSRGISGSYFLVDETGQKHYIIKPLDEDAGCINSNGFASPFWDSPVRKNMPLYKSCMREVLAYEIACSLGLNGTVPKTSFGIFQSDQFYDFSEGVTLEELKRYFEMCGEPDKEKLCSVQEFVPNAKSLFEAIHELEMAGLSDDEIAARFDQSNFEETNILLWATYDTDGHMGNFMVHPIGVDEIGNEIFGLKKIDNGLAFPDKNQQLRNNLRYLPNARMPLSDEARAKIAAIDVDQLAKQFEEMGLDSAVGAMKERIAYLKEVASDPTITIKEIDSKMSKMDKKK